MKIGILTFHRALNYGAVLQCYALFKALSEMGHDVEVIDYRPEAIEKYRMLFRINDFKRANGFAKKIRYVASCIMLVCSKRKTSKKFDEFLNSKIILSPIVRNIENISFSYDVIFFGSDQIWNPETCEGLDKVYYGQFKKGHAKFYAYAASLGRIDLINGNLKDLFGKYVLNYDKIAVREKSVADFLLGEFAIKSEVVCDPSLFLSKNLCDSLAQKPKDDNYVVVFNLDGNPQAVSFAQNIANQIGAKVIMMMAETNHLHRHSYEVRTELSPFEFLGYIKYSKCVVTDSFHATSFSLIMNVNLYTYRQKRNNDRSQMILDVVGLGERMVNASDKVSFSPINYEGVNERLSEYMRLSLSYISTNLKEC